MSEPHVIRVTRRQMDFLQADANEVLFGGAAGGGKSYGQLVDALRYALQYPGSRQLVLRRTLPELENSLVRQAGEIFPRGLYHYVSSRHTGVFLNGSVLDFGYCDSESDVTRYQSVEYDVIRFDELTHFTERMYLYLMSRLRGSTPFPRQMKSTTNPGGVGHGWVKQRFVDPAPHGELFETELGSRVFLPALVQENRFLMEADPDYVNRLKQLPERERRALLLGEWELEEGRFFRRWSYADHVCEPFEVPDHWRCYCALDYGLDMLAALRVVEDEQGFFYVTGEVFCSDLVISEAAAAVQRLCSKGPYFAPPDLWSRQRESGRSMADLFRERGVVLTRVSAARSPGWALLQDWMVPRPDRKGERRPRIRIFSTCRNLIRCLPALEWDPHHPGDCRTRPHEWTHAPDALRYFAMGYAPRHGYSTTPPKAGEHRKELIL